MTRPPYVAVHRSASLVTVAARAVARAAAATSIVVTFAFGAGCGGGMGTDADAGAEFVAQPIDFEPFEMWSSVYLGDTTIGGHPPGPRWGYINHPTTVGATSYPVGTIIVKTIRPVSCTCEADASCDAATLTACENLTDWQLFAMVKRGGGYNPGSNTATDWEFFVLSLDASGAPTILARGEAPVNPDQADGGVVYNGGNLTCNFCHGIPGTAATDHILSTALAPGTPLPTQ